MQLRNANSTDDEAIAALFTASVHGLTGEHYSEAQRAAWAPIPPDLPHWQRRLGEMHVVVAEDAGRDGELAGVIGFHDTGHVDLLFTEPRLARRGVARQLHEHVEQVLAKAGVYELFTEASEVARPFFERCGYVTERREVVQARGVDLPRYVMRKRRDLEPRSS